MYYNLTYTDTIKMTTLFFLLIIKKHYGLGVDLSMLK